MNDVLGWFVWWTIRGVKISIADMQKLLDDAQLPMRLPSTCPRTAFLKAVQDVRRTARKQHLLVRKIYKRPDAYCFGLVDEAVDPGAQDLSYFQGATMLFNPLTGDLTCDRPHRAFDLVQAQYAKYRDLLDSADIRAAVLNLLAENLRVSVRPRGGIYFLPATKDMLVNSLSTVLNALGNGCSLEVVPQTDFDTTRASIYRAFMHEINEEIAVYRAELDAPQGTRRLVKKWEARLAELRLLRNKVLFYAETLKFQGAALVEQLDELTAEMTARLAPVDKTTDIPQV